MAAPIRQPIRPTGGSGIWSSGAHRDQRFAADAGLELADEPVEVGGDPGVEVRQADRLAFLGVGGEVDQPRGRQLGRRVLHVPLGDQDQLEVAPFDPIQLGAHPVEVALPLGAVGLAGEPGKLVDPVDHPVSRHLQPDGVQDGGAPVDHVHDLVAFAAGRDAAGPADQARGAQVALPAGEIGALPVAGGAAPQQHIFGAVVAGEHHHGVASDAELLQQVQQPAEVGVQLQQAVGPVALAALALELLTRDHRHMHE
jgi:hypothetical protein